MAAISCPASHTKELLRNHLPRHRIPATIGYAGASAQSSAMPSHLRNQLHVISGSSSLGLDSSATPELLRNHLQCHHSCATSFTSSVARHHWDWIRCGRPSAFRETWLDHNRLFIQKFD